MARSKTPLTTGPLAEGSDARGDSDGVSPPEKVAVALTYQPTNEDQAPVVSASGRGYLAERIIEMAEESGVPVRSDSDLVELLAATDVGDEIPVEAFIAVAEILRYVYELNGKKPPLPETGDR